MNSSSVIKNISIIVAYRNSGRHLLDMFIDLKLWFSEITIVGPNCSKNSQKIKSLGGKWVEAESCSVQTLWEKGIESVHSEWYLLLEGSEYISTEVKESIVGVSNLKLTGSHWFPIKREIFFLKQRLKYPLEWTYDPKPGLFFKGTDKISLIDHDKIENEPLKGKSIFYSEKTVGEAITNSIHRADHAAVELNRIRPDIGKFELSLKAVVHAPINFFKKWILLRGIREGFEGLVFSLLDTITVVLGYIRYYEKYIRSGKQIENNLDSIKNILIIKLRGLGDAVLATPVIKNISTLMPDVRLSVVTFNFSKPIFENNPRVDEIIGISGHPKSIELKNVIKYLNAKKYDLVINLHARNFSSKIVKKIKARWKINRSYSIREKYSDILIGSDHELDKSSIERDLDCLRAIGIKPRDKNPEIFITNQEVKWAEDFMLKQKINPLKKLIVIHPTTKNSYTDWGLDRFINLATQLINDHGHQVLACFPEQEQSVSKLLIDQLKGIYVHVGSLRQSIALISKADLMIDNCSAPSHISSALKIKTLVLLGADYRNIYRDKEIYKDNSFLFYKNVPCRDTFWSRCLPQDPCKNKICLDHSVEDVLKKSLELIRQ